MVKSVQLNASQAYQAEQQDMQMAMPPPAEQGDNMMSMLLMILGAGFLFMLWTKLSNKGFSG